MATSKHQVPTIVWSATFTSMSLVLPRPAFAQAEPAPAAPAPAPPPGAAPAAPVKPAEAPAAPPPALAPPTPAPPAPAPPAGAAAPPPAPAAATPEAAPPLAAPTPESTPAEEPPKAKEEWKLPPIDVGAWIRVGLQVLSTTTTKIDDQRIDTAYGELHVGGKVLEHVSYTLNFNAGDTNRGGHTVGLLDAIIGLDFLDELHLWSGQLLTPVDRTNFSGPFFTSPWTYPGIMSAGGATVFITPNGENTFGRDVGTVLWGDIGKGMFKYYLGVTHLQPVTDSPLFSGRLAFAAIGKEPGYYGQSTYYGDQDILAIGVGGQYQKDGSALPGTPGNPAAVPPVPATPAQFDNYSEVNADLLAEFRIGDAGTLTGEGAFYHYKGNYNPADNQFFVVASYLSPAVGPGKLQPLFRYQVAKKEGADDMSQIDGQLAYVLKGPNMRGLVGFSHTNLGGGVEGNALEIALQTIMF